MIAISILSSLYFLGFGAATGNTLIFDNMMMAFFIGEIILNFCTSITDVRGREITDMGIIAVNYLKGWFILDLIAVLPIGIATGRWDVDYLLRMVRITKLPNALNMLDGRGLSLVITMLKTTGDREENISVSFAMRYLGTLLELSV
jgi:hypothetical protein